MIVLDTHAWLWWMTKPTKLGRRAARAIDKADRIGVPAISVWEIAQKEHNGQFKFNQPMTTWADDALSTDSRVELLPLLPRISIEAVRLSWPHQDPADRFIVATARVYECALVTSDDAIHESGLVRCVWE